MQFTLCTHLANHLGCQEPLEGSTGLPEALLLPASQAVGAFGRRRFATLLADPLPCRH